MKAPGRPEPVLEPGHVASQRIDQWLWFARIAKSRTLAQALVMRGKVRINRVKADKSSATVRPGDVLTLSLGPRVISIEILGIGDRRGPAPEAQALYRDLTPKPPAGTDALRGVSDSTAFATPPHAVRAEGGGRPTKRERRQIDKFRGRE